MKKRCQWKDNDTTCTKYAHGPGNKRPALYCKRHGGGPRCQKDGCPSSALGDGKGGKPLYCQRHGGGRRCAAAECIDWPEQYPFAATFILDDVPLCFLHYYSEPNSSCRAIRREPLFLGALLCELPALLGLSHAEFDQYAMNHDKNVRSCKLLRRPDLLFCFGFFAVLFEFDENNGHRDRTELSEIEHLEVIRRYVKETAKLKHMYVLRINPEGKQPLFRKRLSTNKEQVWEPTEHFRRKFQEVAKKSQPWIEQAIQGPVPPELKAAFQGTKVEKMFYHP